MAWAISDEYARRLWRLNAWRVVALRIEDACWRLRVWRGEALLAPIFFLSKSDEPPDRSIDGLDCTPSTPFLPSPIELLSLGGGKDRRYGLFLSNDPSRLTSECPLGGVGNLSPEGRTSDPAGRRGHLGGQSGGEHASGGHCV